MGALRRGLILGTGTRAALGRSGYGGAGQSGAVVAQRETDARQHTAEQSRACWTARGGSENGVVVAAT
jgi:hypothetical protein